MTLKRRANLILFPIIGLTVAGLFNITVWPSQSLQWTLPVFFVGGLIIALVWK